MVLKFSSQGNFLKKFGKGKGKGPGEFEQPFDFSVSPDGYVYVSDLTNRLVTIFDSSGNVIKAMRIDGTPGRIVGFDNKNFIVQRLGLGEMFQRYDINGNLLSSFGKFFKEQSSYAILLDLSMYFSDGNIYCALVRGGYILSYDINGKLKYLCETIDKFPLPEIKVTKGKQGDVDITRVMFDPNVPISALNISVSDSLMYILAGTASKREGKVVIDVYHKDSGRYLFSFKFSKLPDTDVVQSCIVSDENVYTAEILKDGSTCVRKYKLKSQK